MSADAPPQTDWWRGAVIYQIYPRSFHDASGDGVGDLKGIAGKLDHVASLGIDAVWISPFFTSPMKDWGYDVADFCDVDPVFGTLADFDALIDRAHALGLKVIIDQVYSHTSDQHAWFAESRASRSNPKADWYVWADPREDGTPPNNWLSVFGGPSWTWDGRRKQYYLHNFLTEQPDLNLHNEEVVEAVLNVARFWLDRGVDGFRLDAVNFFLHDAQLRDNAPAPQDTPWKSPFERQLHDRSQNQPGVAAILERIKEVTNAYGAVFTVAEVADTRSAPIMGEYAANNRLSSAYGFEFLYAEGLTPDLVKATLAPFNGAIEGVWPSWAFSNHDAPRCVSRWAAPDAREEAARAYALLLFALRGTVFLYQGEELALPQAEVPFERLRDPEAVANWPRTLGRDGARTPFPWSDVGAHAGFSDAAETWLPVDPRHAALNAAAQAVDPASHLNFVRQAIALRRGRAALRLGTLRFDDAPDGVLSFTRERAGERLWCVVNLSRSLATLPAFADGLKTLLSTDGAEAAPRLAPYAGFIAERLR